MDTDALQPLPDHVKYTAYYAFSSSRAYLSATIGVSALIGVLWIAVLTRFVRPVMLMAQLLVPVGLFVLGCVMFDRSWRGPSEAQSGWYSDCLYHSHLMIVLILL